jgi:hypothetical protein
MSDLDITGLRAKFAAATPGPWSEASQDEERGWYHEDAEPGFDRVAGPPTSPHHAAADVELIVALRNQGPALLDRVEEAEGAVQGVGQALEEYQERAEKAEVENADLRARLETAEARASASLKREGELLVKLADARQDEYDWRQEREVARAAEHRAEAAETDRDHHAAMEQATRAVSHGLVKRAEAAEAEVARLKAQAQLWTTRAELARLRELEAAVLGYEYAEDARMEALRVLEANAPSSVDLKAASRASSTAYGRRVDAIAACRAARESAKPEPTCTGFTAAWCPVHGSCLCPRARSMDHPDCPLHGSGSEHAEAIAPGAGGRP